MLITPDVRNTSKRQNQNNILFGEQLDDERYRKGTIFLRKSFAFG